MTAFTVQGVGVTREQRDECLPVFHYPDGTRTVGWPGTWQHAASERRAGRIRVVKGRRGVWEKIDG